MFLKFILLFGVCTFIAVTLCETAQFRILAPEFICPKNNSTSVGTLNRTVITIQTAVGSDLDFSWEVKWVPLQAATQRFILLLWQAVRALEAKLNKLQPEPNVYSIQHDELLEGVNYVFNVTARNRRGEISSFKTFHLDNSFGDKTLEEIDGRGELVSIVLVGGQTLSPDVEFIVEAQLTTCHRTQDYYFKWNVNSLKDMKSIDVSHDKGSILVLPPFSFKPTLQYDVTCQVIKLSNGCLLAKTGLPLEITKTVLEVYLGADVMMVSINKQFTIESIITEHDLDADDDIIYHWSCSFKKKPDCPFILDTHNKKLDFNHGISKLGTYFLELKVTVKDQMASANITITTILPNLPTLQIYPMPRILQEGSMVLLSANASNIAPQCTLTWFFATMEYISSFTSNLTCYNCQHGVALSNAMTILSIEESFLDELTDFSNDTESRQVTASLMAAPGRARLLAECGCSAAFECEAQGLVYAELFFQVNESPQLSNLMVSPESGVAMETIFRISTTAAEDQDRPLRYTFMCQVGVNQTLVLGSYMEYMAVETYLPYVADGTAIWIEVCDRRGACSIGPTTVVQVSDDAPLGDHFIEQSRGYISRCDFFMLRRTAVAAIVTYENTGNKMALRKMIETLTIELQPETCQDSVDYEQFAEFLVWVNEKKETIE